MVYSDFFTSLLETVTANIIFVTCITGFVTFCFFLILNISFCSNMLCRIFICYFVTTNIANSFTLAISIIILMIYTCVFTNLTLIAVPIVFTISTALITPACLPIVTCSWNICLLFSTTYTSACHFTLTFTRRSFCFYSFTKCMLNISCINTTSFTLLCVVFIIILCEFYTFNIMRFYRNSLITFSISTTFSVALLVCFITCFFTS